jgi:hypothetical protein
MEGASNSSSDKNKKYEKGLFFTKELLPPFLGLIPLVALGLGLFRVKNGIGEVEGVKVNCVELNNNVDSLLNKISSFLLNDQRWIWIALLFLLIYCCIVFVLREEKNKGDSKTKSLLFLGLNFLSILVVSTFTFPLVPDGGMRHIVIIFVLFLLCLTLFLSKQSNSKPNSLKFFEHPLILLLLAFSALFLVAYVPYFVSNPLASQIGSVSVIALFLTVFVFWGSLLFDYGYETGIPFIIIMLILAIVFSGLDWNDNHHLRELSSSEQTSKQLVKTSKQLVKTSEQPVENSFTDLKTSFENWISSPSRKNGIAKINEFNKNEQNKDKKYYPIYIVSAQGGGITTGYHAALTLSRLQDSSPDFANHVFAISGVSGGSFGTAVFSILNTVIDCEF